MAKRVQAPVVTEDAESGQQATTNVEAISEFLAGDALPVLLVAVVAGFLALQMVRWYRMTRRRKQEE